MKEISLKNGGVTLVDDADYEALMQYRWKLVKMGKGQLHYAFTHKNSRPIGMHRMLLADQLTGKLCADHINGDGLNNTRANLRAVSYSDNAKNTWRARSGLPVRDKATV